MKLLRESYGVCRLDKNDPIPNWGLDGDSITKTEDELSIDKDMKLTIKNGQDQICLKIRIEY